MDLQYNLKKVYFHKNYYKLKVQDIFLCLIYLKPLVNEQLILDLPINNLINLVYKYLKLVNNRNYF